MNRTGHGAWSMESFRIYQKALFPMPYALCSMLFLYITHKEDLFDSAWTADTYCRQIFP